MRFKHRVSGTTYDMIDITALIPEDYRLKDGDVFNMCYPQTDETDVVYFQTSNPHYDENGLMVIYQDIDNMRISIRPAVEFFDGRFEMLFDHY